MTVLLVDKLLIANKAKFVYSCIQTETATKDQNARHFKRICLRVVSSAACQFSRFDPVPSNWY